VQGWFKRMTTKRNNNGSILGW